MFFALSKVLGFLLLPSSVMVIAVAAGLGLAIGTRRTRLGLRLAAAGLLALVACGLMPLGNVLLLPLEERFPPVDVTPESKVAGVILLGGFEDAWVSGSRPGLALNEAAERLTEGVRLARRLPDSTIVFSGGSAALLREGATAANPVGRYIAESGISPARIVLEGRSRNTHENAMLTRELVRPERGKPWVLVTSAAHMPRAVGVFRRAGFDLVPYPVDYRLRSAGDLLRPFESIPSGLERLDLAAREWLGLVAYRLTGRTDALFPGP